MACQAFPWKISICSAKINHVLRCLLSRDLATGRARLRTANRGVASQLQLTEQKEQVTRCPARASCAGSKVVAKIRLGPQSYPIWRKLSLVIVSIDNAQTKFRPQEHEKQFQSIQPIHCQKSFRPQLEWQGSRVLCLHWWIRPAATVNSTETSQSKTLHLLLSLE